LARLAVLRNPDEAGTALELGASEAAAGPLGLSLQDFAVRADADVQTALEAAQSGQAEALMVFNDPLVFANRGQILGFALRHHWPSMFDRRVYVEQRGLMAYGPRLDPAWRRAAYYVDRILKGASPAELPVEQPTSFELLINRDTAAFIGLDLPQSVLLQATEVIQ
jgi:putative ABC transport system substrate-binding protein